MERQWNHKMGKLQWEESCLLSFDVCYVLRMLIWHTFLKINDLAESFVIVLLHFCHFFVDLCCDVVIFLLCFGAFFVDCPLLLLHA